MTIGVVVLPPFKQESKQLIIQSIKDQRVLSNVSANTYGGKHDRHTQLIIGDAKPSNHTLVLPEDEIEHPTHNMRLKYIAYLVEIAKRVDKLLIVSPGTKIPLIMVLIASQIKPLQYIRVIVGNKILTSGDLIAELSRVDKDFLKAQWTAIQKEQTDKQIKIRQENLLKTPNGATLRPYQQQMVDFALAVKRVGLFVDMGLGKTLATLATLDKLQKDGKIDPTRPVLIVAPIMVALDTWAREAEKWGYDMDVKVNIQLSTKKRAVLLDSLLEPQEKLTLFTTNPAQLKPILEHFRKKRVSSPFDVVIVDELSQFKSPDAQRLDHLQQLSDLCEYFFGLTGTPAPNNLIDIWSQMIVIDPQNRRLLGDNFFEYRGRFFEPTQTGRKNGKEIVFEWGLRRNAEQAIYNRMKKTAISMRSEGLIDLPKIVFDNKYVKLPPKAKKLYHKMDKVLRNELRKQEDADEPTNVTLNLDDSNIQIANSAVLTSKLVQLSSGALYDNILESTDDDTNYTVFHDEKLKALKDIVENSTTPILVFYFFKSELERLPKFIEFEHLNTKRKDVKETIAKWNKGEIPVMVAHPASIGHGLNLQDGGHTMVWLTTTWSNEQYRQSIKRLYRSGQKNTVSVIHLLAEGTEDENVVKRIDMKESGQEELMKALDVAQRD